MEEKTFTINLRREFLKKPIYQRTKRALTAVKEFSLKHFKTKEVRIGPKLNEKLWEKGNRKPPAKIKIKGIVEEDIAYIELPGFNFEKTKPKEETKTKGKPTKEEVKQEAKKEQEKELNKELAHEEELKQKKEHHHETIEVPHEDLKQIDKEKESISKKGRVVGSTGKKGAKEPKS